MKRIASIILLVLTAFMAVGQESTLPPQRGSEIDLEHMKWIDSVMTSIRTVQPGATRKDVIKIFTEEGGVSSRTHQTYVYKRCPYIKVDVEFAPVGNQDKGLTGVPEDKVTTISRPYLEYSVYD